MEADYLVAIRIHDFSSTCDECGTYFRYCVEGFNEGEQCLQSHQTVLPGTRLDFSQEFILLRPNPILFRGRKQEWQVRRSLI